MADNYSFAQQYPNYRPASYGTINNVVYQDQYFTINLTLKREDLTLELQNALYHLATKQIQDKKTKEEEEYRRRQEKEDDERRKEESERFIREYNESVERSIQEYEERRKREEEERERRRREEEEEEREEEERRRMTLDI